MICNSHFVSRGLFCSLLSPQSRRRFCRSFSLQMEQQKMLLLYQRAGIRLTSSSSLRLSNMASEACSFICARQKFRASPSSAFHERPLKSLQLDSKINPNPKSSYLSDNTMMQDSSINKKVTTLWNVDQKVVLPKALMSHGACLHSSTNTSSEKVKEECSGLVVGSEKRTKTSFLTVAVDIDEVLGSFLLALNTFISEQYFCEHNISEFHVYDFTEVWQCSRAEADLRVHSFFKSKHFDKGILPIPGAYNSLLQIASFCNLCVVTSRQNVIKEETIAWIERHYSGIFKEVHFGNHFALEGEARTKSEICRGVGAHVLIDDNPGYAMDCAKNGIQVLLFDLNNSYPWSKTQEGPQHPLITRVHNWEEVERILRSKSIDVQT